MNFPYSEPQPTQYEQELESQLDYERKKNMQMATSQMSMFGQNPSEDNLIRWQLDLKEDLDKIYHLLKGDVIKEDAKGNVVYKPADDDDLKPFNEFGVQMIMNIMSFYLNRNTLLSNYDEETIKTKVLDFGFEMSDLILCRYRDMMLTTSFTNEFYKEYGIDCIELPHEKYAVEIVIGGKKMYYHLSNDIVVHIQQRIADHLQRKVELYPMIILELCDSVHSAYLRSLGGGERESLRTARIVSQNEMIGGNRQMMQSQPNPNKKFSLFKPSTWI